MYEITLSTAFFRKTRAFIRFEHCMRSVRNDQITAVGCLIDVKTMEKTRWEVGECPLDRDQLKAGLTGPRVAPRRTVWRQKKDSLQREIH